MVFYLKKNTSASHPSQMWNFFFFFIISIVWYAYRPRQALHFHTSLLLLQYIMCGSCIHFPHYFRYEKEIRFQLPNSLMLMCTSQQPGMQSRLLYSLNQRLWIHLIPPMTTEWPLIGCGIYSKPASMVHK